MTEVTTTQTSKLVVASKINIAATIMFVVTLAKIWDFINPELFNKIDITVGLVVPAAIIYFRIFKTKIAAIHFFWEKS